MTLKSMIRSRELWFGVLLSYLFGPFVAMALIGALVGSVSAWLISYALYSIEKGV